MNGSKLSVSDRVFENGLLCTAMSLYNKQYAKVCSDIIYEAYMQCNDVRRFGACALELCYMAAGTCDLYFEYRVLPWDYSAAYLILQEAGGVLVGRGGETLGCDVPTMLIGANTQKNLEKLLRTAESESGITYSQQQRDAIRAAATSGVLLITGGPGTGKTTILNGVLSVFEQMGLRCVLAAPTGRAAKRRTEVTGRDASTIHRLLEATIDPASGQMVFLKNDTNPLKADVVIVDEMSMVDVLLFESLLRATKTGCRLILVGDTDPLPAVGAGCVVYEAEVVCKKSSV